MTFDPSTAAPESTFDPTSAQEDVTPLRTALKAAVPEDPDNSAKAAAYSRKLHVPMDAVARNLQSIELQDTVMQYDQQLQTSPKLAKAMQDSQALARMAHDDIKPLAKIEAGFADSALAGGEMATLGVAQSIWNTPDAASRVVGYLASGPEQLGLPRMLNPIRGVQQVIDLVAKGQLPTGQKIGSGTNDIADMIGSAQKMLSEDPSTFGSGYAAVNQSGTRADAAMDQALKGNFKPLVDVVSDPGAWAAFIAQAAPSLAIAAKSGGSLQVIGWLEGMQTASSAQDFEKRTGQKVSDADFTQAFAQTALVNSFLEKAGLDKVLGAQGKGIAGVLKAILGEGGTEALQQVNSNAAVKASFDPSQSLSEGVLASAMGGGGSGGGGAVLSNTANKIGESVAARAAEIRKGEIAAQFLQAQLQAANASALRERSPEDFRNLVQQMADKPGGAPSSVYVDSEVLATLPEELLNQLPQSVRDELQDALASSDVVAIPVGDALAIAPGTPLEKMLTEYGRMDPAQMTATEANNAREQSQEWLSKESERIINEAADKTAWQQSVEAVKTNIAAQLNATGRFRESVNDAYATYTSAFYAVLAERTGSTPDAMAAKYPLNIVNQTGKGAVLNSDGTRVGAVSVEGYHYSPAQRNALYTDFFGTGLQGSGREQYQNAADKRLSKRLSFYVDTGTGINPEAGVGAYGHKAQLDNIYDSNSDPLRLKKGGQLAFESAVLDAGFSGYLDRMEGTQSGQVILLGAQKGVVPEQLGSIGKTTGARVPPAATRESKGRDKIVDALNADKTLPQGAPTKARWQELLAKQPTVLKALTEAGVFEGDQKENLFKSELVKRFEAKTQDPNALKKAHGAGVFLRATDTGRVLLVKRSDNVSHPRTWNLVSGAIEKGETPEQAALREAREEIGYNGGGTPRLLNQTTVDGVVFNSYVLDVPAEFAPTLNEENTAHNWYSPESLPENTYPGVAEALGAGTVYNQAPLHRVKDPSAVVTKLLKNLTPDEQRKVTNATAAKIVEQLKDLPSANEMAAVAYAGKAKRGWYENSANALFAVFGFDAPRFAALLAALSPQCSVETNLKNALNTWKNWNEAGRPTDRAAIVQVMGKSVEGKGGVNSVLDAWINNSVRALTSEDGGDLVLSGPKVNSFFKNLIGHTQEVTLDAWVSNYALVSQTIFKGTGFNPEKNDPGKGPGYLAMSAKVREAAKVLTKLTGEEWTPSEVQETIWSWSKALYESVNTQGETRSARAFIEDGALTDELINSTPDFSTLFYNPTYSKILNEAGYGEQLNNLQRAAGEASAATATEESSAGREAGPFDSETQRRYELQAARRLERLAENRGDARVAQAEQKQDWASETFAQSPSQPVTVNIGLDIPGGGKLTVDEVVAALELIGVNINQQAVHQSDTEQTLVAELDRPLTAEEADALSTALRQEAVAQRVGDAGELYGPKADQWKPFNPDYFLNVDGTRNTAPVDIGAELAAAIQADPEAAMAEYAALPESDGGRVINTDIARELSPAYREDRTRSGEVHEAASAFTKAMYAAKLAQPTPEGKLNKVLFTAGGTGAGKSTGLALVPAAEAAEIIYDTNMNTLSSAVTKIDQALEAGRTVDIIYVFRDPVEALTAGALPRAMRMGRTVPLQDHADTHVGARETATLLQERYKDDPRVVITAIDNSRGRGNATVTALDKIPQIADNDLKGSLYEALKTEFKAGRISEQVFAGTSGEKVGQQTGGPADGRQYQQTVGAKGTFNPKSLELALNANADLSTFLHESAHFFLEVMADVSRNPTAPADITADMATLLGWFGVKDLASWDKMSLDQKRVYHERFAESFEQYLLEGKSPVVEMRPLFRKFRAWMTNVYKSVKDFVATHPDTNIKLSDEVRQVFDRMLATREQIAEAEQSAGLLPDDAATEAAVDQLTARSLRDMKWMNNARNKAIKALQKEAAGVRKKILEEVTAEANALPEFAAKDVLDKSKKENKQQLNNTELAIVADAYGYPSVEEMIRSIDAAGNKADYIEGRTDQRMLEENGDLVDQRAVEDAANEAIHNSVRARVLATELKTQSEALAVRAPTGRDNVAGKPITTNALVEAAKLFASNVVGRAKIKELKAKAWQYTMAERRSAKAWQEATKKGDTMAAVKAKQDQMLNHAAAKGALDAQDEVRKIGEFFGKVTKGNNEKVVDKGRDPDIVNAARAVLGAYGIGTPSSKTAQEYLDLVKANDPDLWAILQPSVDSAERATKPADQLTLEELQGLHEEIQAMWYLAKNSRQMEVAGNKLDIADLADELIKKVEEKGVPATERGQFHALTPREILATKLQFAKAILRRVEQWSESMDGKYGGPFLRYIFQPVKEAADRYRTDKTVARKAYKDLVAKVGPSMTKGLIEAPELGYTFGKGHNSIGHAELLHAILHTGNDSNKRKLLLGRKWATENPDGTLDTSKWDTFLERMHNTGILGKVHYDFAQGVWDLLESTKPLAQQAHREVFGRYFNEVTANTLSTPYGDYRGGYVPAVADSRLTADADLRAMENAEKEAMTFAFPTTNKGFTKSRVDYNRPLVLDLRTIPQHLDKVLMFSHMEPAVRSANRLLREKGVSTMLNRMDPSVYSGMLLPWLNRSAKQIVETPIAGDGGVSRIASVIRARAGMALMFGNISNTLQQVSGFTAALLKVNAGDMLRATASYLAHPKQMSKMVSESSTYMKNRMDSEIAAINGAIDDIVLDSSLYEDAQRWTARHGYFMQSAVDNVMGPIIWTGAYNQAIAKGETHDDAVRFADGTIRQTQGSTLPEDISRLESGPAYARLFTQFIGYFNMVANTNATAIQQIADETGLKRGAGKALYVVTAGLLVPLWIAEAIAVGMRGGPDDKDKDGYLDDWIAAVLGFGTIRGVLATVPFIGQLGNAAINRFNNNPADDRISLSPAVSLLEGTVGNAATVYKLATGDADKVNKRNAVRDVASAVSIFTGLPASFAARPLGYLAGVATDKIEPTGPVDAVRGLLTGTPSPESKQ